MPHKQISWIVSSRKGDRFLLLTIMVQKSTNIFAYEGNNITFAKGDDLMINATQMARPFGKRPAKWLELPSTQEFISQLSAIRKSDRLIETVNGVGTWMHEDVALEFARWLSPLFAIWCNDRIKQLLLDGVTYLEPKAFKDVPMVITSEGKQGYYFRDVLSAVGYSRMSGTANDYKKRYPNDFFQLAGRNYCSPRIAQLIGKRAEIRQLEAEMMQSLPSGEEVCL